MIYEESEEETCSKTTHITTNMCEYDNDDSTEDEDDDEAEKDEEIQEQDIEMILEESPKQDTKEKLLKRSDNSMANFKNKHNNNEKHTDEEDTDWIDNQLEQTLIESENPENTVKYIMAARKQARALKNTSKDT